MIETGKSELADERIRTRELVAVVDGDEFAKVALPRLVVSYYHSAILNRQTM